MSSCALCPEPSGGYALCRKCLDASADALLGPFAPDLRPTIIHAHLALERLTGAATYNDYRPLNEVDADASTVRTYIALLRRQRHDAMRLLDALRSLEVGAGWPPAIRDFAASLRLEVDADDGGP